jgi:hypothetical protein
LTFIRIIPPLLAFAVSLGAAANASALVRVQQTDGSIQEYPNAIVRYSKEAHDLTITTADGKGTLTIDQAACSYVDNLYRCLVTDASLSQNGQTHPIVCRSGTIYANTTGGEIKLPLSTQGVPPRGIVMALQTKAGTYISMTGTIDGGVK